MHYDIEDQIKMSYKSQCLYLKHKYGLAPQDYYVNEACRTRSRRNSRTAEGLFLHHDAESNGHGNIGEPHLAKLYPFEFQKRHNLSYCNYLEHLLLHLKINTLGCSTFVWPFELKYFFHSLGFFWIINDINSLYVHGGSDICWKNNCYFPIKDCFEDYVSILKGTLCFIDENYIGSKSIEIAEGTQLCFDIINPKKSQISLMDSHIATDYYIRHNATVYKINALEGIAHVKLDNGSNQIMPLSKLKTYFDFNTQKNIYIQSMSELNDGTVWPALQKRLMDSYSQNDKLISEWISNSIYKEL